MYADKEYILVVQLILQTPESRLWWRRDLTWGMFHEITLNYEWLDRYYNLNKSQKLSADI